MQVVLSNPVSTDRGGGLSPDQPPRKHRCMGVSEGLVAHAGAGCEARVQPRRTTPATLGPIRFVTVNLTCLTRVWGSFKNSAQPKIKVCETWKSSVSYKIPEPHSQHDCSCIDA